MNRLTPWICGFAASFAVLASAGAHASNPRTELQVRIADLDPSTAAGAREILRRLQSAAAEVCGLTPRPSSVPGAAECADRAVGAAVYSAKLPRLTSAYVNQTGRLPPR
jgi:UrcA family protein